MIESYSALLKSLQEVIHREGFDLSTPMVRTSIISVSFESLEMDDFAITVCIFNYCSPPLQQKHLIHIERCNSMGLLFWLKL